MQDKNNNWLSDAFDQASRGANRALTKDNFCKAIDIFDRIDSVSVSLYYVREEYNNSRMPSPHKEWHFITKAFLCIVKSFFF